MVRGGGDPPYLASRRAASLVAAPDLVDLLCPARGQRTHEGDFDVGAGGDSLAIEAYAEAEGRLRRAVRRREVPEFLADDDALFRHLLRGPAHRGDANASGPARSGQLLDRLLDGSLPLVQELPLPGCLVARDVAGRLQRGERRLHPFAQRGDLGGEPAHQQLGEGLRHARDPGDSLQQPQDLEDACRFDGHTGHPLGGIADGAYARSAEIFLRQQVVLDGVEDLVEADDDAELLVGDVL